MSRAASAIGRSDSTTSTAEVMTAPTVSLASRKLISQTDRLVAGDGRFRRMSRSVTIPITRSCSTTMRWRIRSSFMRCRACSIGVSGATVIGLAVMRSRTRMASLLGGGFAGQAAVGEPHEILGGRPHASRLGVEQQIRTGRVLVLDREVGCGGGHATVWAPASGALAVQADVGAAHEL